MMKMAILMKRCAGLSVEDFQDHLRTRYAPLAARGPGLRRYVQSCALPQGYARGELLFDAVDEMWFDSLDDYARCVRSAEFAAARADEAAFLDRARTVTMPVDVHVIKDGAVPGNAVKNIEFVNRRPGMALEPFRSYWRNVHGCSPRKSRRSAATSKIIWRSANIRTAQRRPMTGWRSLGLLRPPR